MVNFDKSSASSKPSCLLILLLMSAALRSATGWQCPPLIPKVSCGIPPPAAQVSEKHSSSRNPPLPRGVCWWEQGSLIKGTRTGEAPADCKFQVRDKRFLEILPEQPTVQTLAEVPAHEAGVWLPEGNTFWFTSTPTGEPPNLNSRLGNVSMDTGEVNWVMELTAMANGAVVDLDGNLLITMQGKKDVPAHIFRLNPKTLEGEVIADNWMGLEFNSPNDIIVTSDGYIYFTDPIYGYKQEFRPEPKVASLVYRVSPDGKVDAVASELKRPNGLALSPDGKQVFITDSGVDIGDGSKDIFAPHWIEVWNRNSEGFLVDRRKFAIVAKFGPPYGQGIPDGIKVDTEGRVYAACSDGVQVFTQEGGFLGLIRIPEVTNFGFAGPALDRLVLMNDESIQIVQLRDDVRGANLYYAEKVLKKGEAHGAANGAPKEL